MISPEWQEILLPVLAAVLTGAVIGFERELRTKSAGLKTHTLVCLSSTLLMIAGADQGEWTFRPIDGATVVADPTRMAHGILTGIGFLGAGVIFRQGSAIHGLTTAASLWMTAALGVLYGTGLYLLAGIGLGATLLVLVAFRLFQLLIPDYAEFALQATCTDPIAHQKIASVLKAHSATIGHTAFRAGPDGRLHITGRVWTRTPQDVVQLGSALRGVPEVSEVSLEPSDHAARRTT